MMFERNQIPFLLSSWYSGATLLTMLLDSHPEIISNGEAFPFGAQYRYPLCSCGKTLQACEFYRYAGAHMWEGDGYNPQLFRREPSLELPDVIQRFAKSPRFSGAFRHNIMRLSKEYNMKVAEFTRAHLLFMERALDFSGARVYLDATKSLSRAEILLRSMTGPKHLWLLVRDCRGFCNSALRIRKWPVEKASHAAREWVDYIRFSKRLAKKYPETSFRIVRYEDLCASPINILNDLFSEIGVSPRKTIYQDNYTPHLLGNKMRMTFNGKIELKEQWRTELDEKTQNEITRVAGDRMSEMGYI